MLDDDDGALAALHDAAYRYAFRRSVSSRLASSAALESVESLDGVSSPSADRVAVLRSARLVLERYLPTTLPPRAVGDSALKAALAGLAPADREFLLLHHWDGLSVGDAARLTGGNPDRLPAVETAVETACARAALRAGPALAAALTAADPAATIPDGDLARSRGGTLRPGIGPTVEEPARAGTSPGPAPPRHRRPPLPPPPRRRTFPRSRTAPGPRPDAACPGGGFRRSSGPSACSPSSPP
ncbi:hypothetical protein [Arthrobacter sp. Ld5]|uniref:hypothetical protein n=1 Tax=Arthrobacter sp. Ld5 TaxID=649152 RepID=UPI003EB862B7